MQTSIRAAQHAGQARVPGGGLDARYEQLRHAALHARASACPLGSAHLIELWRAGKHTSTELAELFSVARSTIYRAVQRADEPTSAA